MKILAFSLLLLCCTSVAFSQNYVIDVNVTGFKDNTKFYLKDVANDDNIDSAILINNKFTMTGKGRSVPINLWLCTTYNKDFYYAILFVASGHVKVSGDISQFPFKLKITGSKDQELFNQLYTPIGADYKRRDSLMKAYFALAGDTAKVNQEKHALSVKVHALDISDDSLRMDFIRKHLNSYVALNELGYLKSKYNRDTLQKMYNALLPVYRDSHYGKVIGMYIKIGDPLKNGDMCSDFAGQDREGRTHKLSDIKNKYILIDFSETYCGPCYQSVQELKDVSSQYADKLEIVTFSGDVNRKTWMEGVNRDKPVWLSISDGKGIDSETSLKYGVSGYPTLFLIDPNGKIVALQVGYGAGVVKDMIKSAIR